MWIVRGSLLLGIALCAWLCSAPACPTCAVEDLWLALGDGTPIHARLYLPARRTPNRPAVVVCHGYLGNAGFLEVPWAADMNQLGVVSLFLDRRGHGRSGGSWWPSSDGTPVHLEGLYPDIQAAVAYLRRRAPVIDPARIALVGHSDGGTGAMVVASADWDVAATVALSASVAPWEYVNHVAPQNLLLLYGSEDRFVLHDTDRQLIKNATRGYLDGEGQIGDLRDGSARRLVRVAGRGHVDLVYSERARRETLAWLAEAFDLDRATVLSPLRLVWVGIGLGLLLLLVLFWNGLPAADASDGWLARTAKLLVVAGAWVAGLAVGAWAGPQLDMMPVQEGSVVAAVLCAELLLMGGLTFVLPHRPHPDPRPGENVDLRRGERSLPLKKEGEEGFWNGSFGQIPLNPPLPKGEGSSPAQQTTLSTLSVGEETRGYLTEVARGAAAAVVVVAGLETLFGALYTIPHDVQRMVLFVGFLGLTAPAFAMTCLAATWVGGGRGQVLRGVAPEVFLAALTATLTPLWFVRMSMLPLAFLALTLLFVGAYRAGGRSAVSAAAFGAVIYARAAAVVCALY